MQDNNKQLVDSIQNLIISTNGQTFGGKKLQVGIISARSEATGINNRMDSIIASIKNGIIASGANACELPVFSISNTLANAKKLSNITEIAKTQVQENIDSLLTIYNFDALIFVPFGESSVKGMLLASVKTNIPSLFVNIGASRPCFYRNEMLTEGKVYTLLAEKYLGKIEDAVLNRLLLNYIPQMGDGVGFETANTLACLTEVLGLSLNGNGSAEAGSVERMNLAKSTGETVISLVKDQLSPRKILNKASYTNAFTYLLATGADVASITFLKELASVSGYDFTNNHISELSSKVPFVASIYPLSENLFMNDFHQAGGVFGVLSRLYKLNLINEKAIDYNGTSFETLAKNSKVYNDKVIVDGEKQPILPNFPLCVLGGNIAEKGAFVRRTSLFKGLNVFSGYAKVFEDEESACHAIYGGRIRKGSVVVVRNQGDKGGPGKPQIAFVQAALVAAGLENDVAIVTDGRVSSLFRGIVVSEILPEAYDGEMLALVQDDDTIDIDLVGKTINVKLASKDIVSRRKSYAPYIRHENKSTDKFFKRK